MHEYRVTAHRVTDMSDEDATNPVIATYTTDSMVEFANHLTKSIEYYYFAVNDFGHDVSLLVDSPSGYVKIIDITRKPRGVEVTEH